MTSVNVKPDTHNEPAPPNAPWLVSSVTASQDPDAVRWSWYKMVKPRFPEPEFKWPSVGTNADTDDKPDWRGVRRSQVNVLPMPEPFTLRRETYLGYYWFDTPDWADPFSKMWFVTKQAFALAAFALPLGYMHEGFPKQFSKVWPDYLRRYSLPVFGLPIVLGASVICIANLRGKADDNWNYFWGGMATAVFNGARAGRWPVWWQTMCYGVLPIVLIKEIHERNNAIIMRTSYKNRNMTSLYGGTAEHGMISGDYTFGYKDAHRDPGRTYKY